MCSAATAQRPMPTLIGLSKAFKLLFREAAHVRHGARVAGGFLLQHSICLVTTLGVKG